MESVLRLDCAGRRRSLARLPCSRCQGTRGQLARGFGCDGDLAAVAYVCIRRGFGGGLLRDDDGLGGIGNE